MNLTDLDTPAASYALSLRGHLDVAMSDARDLAGKVHTRELSLVITKIEEAQMWFEKFCTSARTLPNEGAK